MAWSRRRRKRAAAHALAMGTVTEFPPKLMCPLCSKPLRPATRAEISADLSDPRYRELALGAAQGKRNWNPPEEFSDWKKDISWPASWLFRCDTCDHRSLWSHSNESSNLPEE